MAFYFLFVLILLFALWINNHAGWNLLDRTFSQELTAQDVSFRDELRFEEAEEFFETHPEFVSNGFDFPVGAPNAKGYYDLQPFGKNFHLGEDWNAIGRNEFPV